MTALLLLLAAAGPDAAPPDVEITNVAPKHVDYPTGPVVIVRNRARQPGHEVWVIRHLDSMIVKRYPLSESERWEQRIDIAPPGVPVPGVVTGAPTTVPFAVVVVASTREVKASAPFDARVVAGRPSWPTVGVGTAPHADFVASGEITDAKPAELTIKDTLGVMTKIKFTAETSAWGAGNIAADRKPSTGDSVSVIYSHHEGYGVARQIAYRPAGTLPNPWSPGSAYIGTLKAVQPAGEDGVLVETMKYDGRWLVNAATEKALPTGTSSVKDLKAGVLLGVRVKEGTSAQSPRLVERLFVLTEAPQIR
jgi:hypothetical protein